MLPFVLPAAIGLGSSLLGGLFGSNSTPTSNPNPVQQKSLKKLAPQAINAWEQIYNSIDVPEFQTQNITPQVTDLFNKLTNQQYLSGSLGSSLGNKALGQGITDVLENNLYNQYLNNQQMKFNIANTLFSGITGQQSNLQNIANQQYLQNQQIAAQTPNPWGTAVGTLAGYLTSPMPQGGFSNTVGGNIWSGIKNMFT
jgi:hypothetical protein